MADVDVSMPTQDAEAASQRTAKRTKKTSDEASSEPTPAPAASSESGAKRARKQTTPKKAEEPVGSLLARKKAAAAAKKAAAEEEAPQEEAPADEAAEQPKSKKATAAKKTKTGEKLITRGGKARLVPGDTGVASNGVAKDKKPHRYRPGTRAKIEIRQAQKSTDPMFRMLPFARLVREIVAIVAKEIGAKEPDQFRFQRAAMLALREGTEAAGVTLMQGVNSMAAHAKRQTIFPKDFHRLLFMLREFGIQSPFITKSGGIPRGSTRRGKH